MKLTKSTIYIVELTNQEFTIIGDALYALNEDPDHIPSNPTLLAELTRRFYEKE